MFLKVDPAQPLPVYAQIVAGVRGLVVRGALRPGERLPSVRELAVSLRVNRNTVSKAYQTLESGGWVTSRAGQGTFVRDEVPPDGGSATSRRVHELIDELLLEAHRIGLSLDELSDLVRSATRRTSLSVGGASKEEEHD